MTKTTNQTNNPFEAMNESTASNRTNRINASGLLVEVSHRRAMEVVKSASNPEIGKRAQKVLENLTVEPIFELFDFALTPEVQAEDAEVLKDCTEDELKRLLESRRSDRSKLKAKNPASNLSIAVNYMASGYAEKLVRSKLNLEYKPGITTEIDEADADAIGRKIKSMQSKACRLRKTAPYVEADKAELEAVETEIDRLRGLKGTPTRTTGNSKVTTTTIQEVLDMLNYEELDDAGKIKYEQLKALLK